VGRSVKSRPLIGVSTSEVRLGDKVDQTPQGDPPRREMSLGLKYVQAIESAGGIPLVMPPLALPAIEPLLDRLSGICLSGGPDLDPTAYAERPHPELGPTEPELDRFELELARNVWDRGLPLLAICRGMQALNVARGGTLHQHIPERFGDQLEHRQSHPAQRPAHMITIAAGSHLMGLVGKRRLEVNSFHHQAVAQLGSGLHEAARAPDGVIEAVEAHGTGFLMGVQWHAECMTRRKAHAALFEGLVEAAREFEAVPTRRIRAA
jgi:putative glutamine amidotransferase